MVTKKRRATKTYRLPSFGDFAKQLVMERTWQLLLIIVLPILAGYILDRFFYTFPGLTVAGLIEAALNVTILARKNVKSLYKVE